MTGQSDVSYRPIMHIDHELTAASSSNLFDPSEEIKSNEDLRIMTLGQTVA